MLTNGLVLYVTMAILKSTYCSYNSIVAMAISVVDALQESASDFQHCAVWCKDHSTQHNGELGWHDDCAHL